MSVSGDLAANAGGASGTGLGGDVSLGHYLILTLQIGLFLVLLYRFDLDSRAFLHVGILTFFGFSVHYFLPFHYRLPFFLLLSLLSIELVFGFQDGRWS